MIDRRTVLLGMAATLVAPAFPVRAQRPKVWRIGFLSGGPRPATAAPPAPLREALEKLGYVTGKNLVFESRWAEADRSRLPAFATEVVGLDVDLLVTMGGPAAEAAKRATT